MVSQARQIQPIVLVVTSRYPPRFSGAGLRAQRHVTNMEKFYGISSEVATVWPDRKNIPKAKGPTRSGPPVNYLWLPTRGLKRSNYMTSLLEMPIVVSFFYRLIRNRPYVRIIHTLGGTWFELSSILVGKMLGRKTIFEQTLMGGDDPLTLTRRSIFHFAVVGWFKLLILKHAVDKMICLSPALQNASVKSGIGIDKIWTRPNAVSPDKFFPLKSVAEKRELRQRLRLPIENIILLSVGRICERKNQEFLVRSLPYLRAPRPVTLVLIGPLAERDKSYYLRLATLAKGQKPDTESVLIIPELKENIDEYMRASDIFVFASRAEGFGTVLLEAQMSGLPVVMRHLPTISETIVWNRKCGKFVATDDPAVFAEGVSEVLENLPTEDLRFRAALHEQTSERFSYDSLLRGYKEIYDSLLKK